MFHSKGGQELIQKMNKLANYLIISLLWSVCSLPIITIGAATSAMYRTLHKCVEGEKDYILQTYFQAFKNTFVYSTIIWTSYLVVLFIFMINQGLLETGLAHSPMNQFSQIFLMIICICALPFLITTFGYVSRFTDGFRQAISHSFIFSIIHIKSMMTILFILLCTIALIWLVPLLTVILPAFSMYKIYQKLEIIYTQYIPDGLGE